MLGLMLLLALAAGFGWDRLVNSRLDNQQARNQLLQTNITVLDKQIAEIEDLKKRRQELLDRMLVIQALQGNRSEIVKIFDEFSRAIPDGVFFTKMDRKGQQVSLEGYAESNNRVSALMRKLDKSEKFAEPNLTVVESDNELGEQGSKFKMRFQLKGGLPKDPSSQGGT